MKSLRIPAGILCVVSLALGLLLTLNADRGIGGALIISGAILLAGLVVASAITEGK